MSKQYTVLKYFGEQTGESSERPIGNLLRYIESKGDTTENISPLKRCGFSDVEEVRAAVRTSMRKRQNEELIRRTKEKRVPELHSTEKIPTKLAFSKDRKPFRKRNARPTYLDVLKHRDMGGNKGSSRK